MEKRCFKCEVIKPLTDFYKHKKMGDGHLNKCKDCAKSDVKKHTVKLKKDPEWVESEKKRGRDKYHRLGYKGRHNPTAKRKKEMMRAHFEKYPEKRKAHGATNKMKPKTKGNHLHHWSYRPEHSKDVIELDPKTHAFAHRYMKYDQEQMMYRVFTDLHGWMYGELIDSKEKHKNFIACCLAEREY